MGESYIALPGFESVVLEESYVLEIVARYQSVTLRLDIVLATDHPAYSPPGPRQQYCVRKGTLRFDGVTSITWAGQTMRPGFDATGEIDYDTIYDLIPRGDCYRLYGGFGAMRIRASVPPVILLDGPSDQTTPGT